MLIQVATKYTPARRPATRPARGVRTSRSLQGLFLPTLAGSAQCLRDWYWRELKEGGQLYNYLHRERAHSPQRLRLVARLMHGFQQNPQSSFRRVATMPAKEYHRWKDTDEHFFADDNNLRSLKRDNPDACVYVPPRQLPRARFHKRYQLAAKP